MKICILANPRSGSKSLLALLQSTFWHLKYYSVSEPFNTEHHEIMGTNTYDFFSRIIKSKNVIIKTLVNQKPERYTFIENWYEDLFNIFDKVILLDRIDKTAQTESYVYWKTKGEFGRWHVPSVYNFDNITNELYNETFEYLCKQSSILEKLSLEKNIPIYYYEDIFINKSNDILNDLHNYLEIERNEYNINKFIISDVYKVRLQNSKKILI